eukprot:4383361-Ditylum_brightwellii.AAC.1
MDLRKSLPVECTKKVGSTCKAFSENLTSTWITPPRPSDAALRASGMKSVTRPVMRSSNLEPMQMTRSDSWIM